MLFAPPGSMWGAWLLVLGCAAVVTASDRAGQWGWDLKKKFIDKFELSSHYISY